LSLACQEDARIRACLNQDDLFEVPFFNMPDGKTMDQPYLLMLHREAPSDAQLTERKVTRPEFERRYADSMKKIDAALATTKSDAYRYVLPTPENTHDSFSDSPLLRAAGIGPEAQRAEDSLKTIGSIVLAFFDKTLGGSPNTVFSQKDPNILVLHSAR